MKTKTIPVCEACDGVCDDEDETFILRGALFLGHALTSETAVIGSFEEPPTVERAYHTRCFVRALALES